MRKVKTICFVMIACSGYSQQTLKNALTAEFLGNAVYYSLNYERTFPRQIIARTGFGYLPKHGNVISRSYGLTMLGGKNLGHKSSHLELLAGLAYLNSRWDDTEDEVNNQEILGTAWIGYRYQRPGKGFLFRIGYTPFYGQGAYYHWGGLAIGTSF
jgi:hypothetical protein